MTYIGKSEGVREMKERGRKEDVEEEMTLNKKFMSSLMTVKLLVT